MRKWIMLLVLGTALAHGQTVTNGNFGAAQGQRGRAEKRPAGTNESSAPKREKAKGYPFHGELDSVDPGGRWLRLRGKTKAREIVVTKETRIFREKREEPLKGLKPGERVTGTVFRNAEGKEQARTIRAGPAKSPE